MLDALTALEDHGEFIRRHIAPSEAEIAAMLREVGAPSLDALVARTVPAAIREADLAALPAPVNEAAAIADLRALSEQNRQIKSLIGLGYHGTHTRRSSCATSWRTRAGTPPTRPIRPRSPRAGWRRWSISRPW